MSETKEYSTKELIELMDEWIEATEGFMSMGREVIVPTWRKRLTMLKEIKGIVEFHEIIMPSPSDPIGTVSGYASSQPDDELVEKVYVIGAKAGLYLKDPVSGGTEKIESDAKAEIRKLLKGEK